MGKQYIDIIWVLPCLLFVGWTWLVYRLGIEVGRVFQEREDRAAARERHPAGRQLGNVRVVRGNENVIHFQRKSN